MAPPFRLEIQGDVTVFAFDVEGEWSWEQEFSHQVNDPPMPAEIREVWTFRGCRIVGTTDEDTWDDFLAFRARLEVRGSTHPTYARLVRDPAGANVVELTLGPSTYDRFRIESVSGGPDGDLPAGSYRAFAPVDLRVSARRALADADGIVLYEQTISNSYGPDALRTLSWRTRIMTVEGTSAVTKAQSFAAFDLSAIGASYAWDTNGPNGIDYEYVGDERTTALGSSERASAYTPTEVVCVSRARQFGVTIGSPDPGSGVGSVHYSEETEIDGKKRVRTWRASAVGPGAAAWVAGKKPALPLTRTIVVNTPSARTYSATWVLEDQPPDEGNADGEGGIVYELEFVLTGGAPVIDWEPTSGGFPPVRFDGGLLPAQLTLSVRVLLRGGEGSADELPFPAILPEPWVLDRDRSREAEPRRLSPGREAGADEWERRAELTYWAPTLPERLPGELLASAAGRAVRSYYLRSQ